MFMFAFLNASCIIDSVIPPRLNICIVLFYLIYNTVLSIPTAHAPPSKTFTYPFHSFIIS